VDLNEIVNAIGGPTDIPVQPDGGSDVAPLAGLGDGQGAAEAFPARDPGAGTPSTGGLTPNPQEPSDGSVMRGYRGGTYSNVGPDNAPAQFDISTSQVGRLTAGARNRPEATAAADGQPANPADEAGLRQTRLDAGQGRGVPSEFGSTPKRFRPL